MPSPLYIPLYDSNGLDQHQPLASAERICRGFAYFFKTARMSSRETLVSACSLTLGLGLKACP